MKLFSMCTCGSGNVLIQKKVMSTHPRATQECVTCGSNMTWDSQPFYGTLNAGNIPLAVAKLFAGASLRKTIRILESMKVATIARRTFFWHQERILQPSIEKDWGSGRRVCWGAMGRGFYPDDRWRSLGWQHWTFCNVPFCIYPTGRFCRLLFSSDRTFLKHWYL